MILFFLINEPTKNKKNSRTANAILTGVVTELVGNRQLGLFKG